MFKLQMQDADNINFARLRTIPAKTKSMLHCQR